MADLARNTPSLVNLVGQTWYGWDGASDSLWLASIRPLFDAREFDSSPAIVARLFARDPELAACYRKVFGVDPQHKHQRTVANVGKALAAYQETLLTARTAFDDFRDALAANTAGSDTAYPQQAQRGLKLFVGAAGCVGCHKGAKFSDNGFHAVFDGPAGAAAPPDSGRLAGAAKLRANRLNLLGVYNDDPTRRNASATQRTRVQAEMRNRFRTPGLRNIGSTGPYMHDGRIDSLTDAVRHPQPQAGAASTRLRLNAGQVDDLLAFLATLAQPRERPLQAYSEGTTPCP